MKNKRIQFLHGEAIISELTDHLSWFIPALLKDIDKLLKGIDSSINPTFISKGSTKVKYEIFCNSYFLEVELSFKEIKNLNDMYAIVIDSINNTVIKKTGFGLVCKRVKYGVYLFLSDKAINEVDIINDQSLFDSITPESTTENKGFKTFDNFKIESKSQIFEKDYKIMIFDSEKERILTLLQSIADLDPENDISFVITELEEDQYFMVELNNALKKMQVKITQFDFEKIGTILNEFNGNLSNQHVCIDLDEDNFIYIYCSRTQLRELKHYGLVSDSYKVKPKLKIESLQEYYESIENQLDSKAAHEFADQQLKKFQDQHKTKKKGNFLNIVAIVMILAGVIIAILNLIDLTDYKRSHILTVIGLFLYFLTRKRKQ